jgi:hypothetical protein
VTNDVLNEPATKADLKRLETDLKDVEQRLEDKLASKADLKDLEQRLEKYATKVDLEGWAERILAVVRDMLTHALVEQTKTLRTEAEGMRRQLREELGADIRGYQEVTRAELRAHVEELKATNVPRPEFAAHRDDAALHRQPRRRRS